MTTAKKNKDVKASEAKKPVQIVQMVTGFENINGQNKMILFGLGDNNKVYVWQSMGGFWVPNWAKPQPIVPPSETVVGG